MGSIRNGIELFSFFQARAGGGRGAVCEELFLRFTSPRRLTRANGYGIILLRYLMGARKETQKSATRALRSVKRRAREKRRMTEYEKMVKGLVYDPSDKEIMGEQMQCIDKLWEFNRLKPSQLSEKTKYMKENFAACGENCYIELPFHANWGGRNVHFGNGVYANFNLTIVDDGHVYVGDKVMFGPNVTVATANHPIEPSLREKGFQYNKDVFIGENVWIGAGAVIVPGVRIGKNSVIGGGSVVTKDIPENVVAVGNPCRVLRPIGERDKRYFYKDEEIDWDNL